MHLHRLTSHLQQPDRVIAAGRAGAKRMQTATGMRRARSAPASAFGPMPVRSAVTAMLTAESSSPSPPWRSTARDASRCRWQARSPWPSSSNQCVRESCTRCNTHSTVAVGGGADMSDIPQIAGEQNGAAMRDGTPGTLSSESRRRMSSRTIPVSRKRRDTWPVEVTAFTAPRRPRVRASRPARSRTVA